MIRPVRSSSSLAALLAVFSALTWAAPPIWSQDTHVRLDRGGVPGLHIDVAPPPTALVVSRLSSPPGTRISFTGFGPSFIFEFASLPGIPFGVGVHDIAGLDPNCAFMARLKITQNNSFSAKPVGAFEVRQVQRDASGNFTRLWILFQHFPDSDPTSLPLVGEIRWNADTTLYLKCPRFATAETGDSATFQVNGVDTRGRPVVLSATGLPEGATFTSEGGTGTFRWPGTPLNEGLYPIRFSLSNDEGRMDTTTTYLRVARPLRLTTSGDAADGLTLGRTSVLSTARSTMVGSAGASDSTISFNLFSTYQSRTWVLRPPANGGLKEGTYEHAQLDGQQASNEPGLLVIQNGTSCPRLGPATFMIRECSISAGMFTSLWAEVVQSCSGSSGQYRGEIRYNCSATLDVQAPASIFVTEGDAVAFDVTSLSAEAGPVQLSALSLPEGATFSDHEDGTGALSWDSTPAAGAVTLISFVAETPAGLRDTVTTRIRSQTRFRVSLQPAPGSFEWGNSPWLYAANSGTLTFGEASDSSFTASVRGQGSYWDFVFWAPVTRRLTPGLYDNTVRDNQRTSSKARFRARRSGFPDCTEDSWFHVRRLTRGPDGKVLSFWVVFSVAGTPGQPLHHGEIRYNADTTIVLTSPGEVWQTLGGNYQFEIGATASSGGPLAFSLLVGPPGSSLMDHGDGSATFLWAGGPPTPGLTRVVLRTSAGSTADTTPILLRTNAPARFTAWSAANDPVGLGANEDQTETTAHFQVQNGTNGRVIASIATPSDLWSVQLRAPQSAAIAPGIYANAKFCGGCFSSGSSPRLDVLENGRSCPFSVGEFDVRRIRRAPDGSIRSLWVRFAQSCPGSGALSGDLRFNTDTSVYLRAPQRVSVEAGGSLAITISAVDTRGLPVSITTSTGPGGSTLLDHGDGTATFQWPLALEGARTVDWIATSQDGASDTVTTTIDVLRTALFVIQSTPGDPVGNGSNLRLTATDGVVTAVTQGDSAVKVAIASSAHPIEMYFSAPARRDLREGVYAGARPYGLNERDEPGIQIVVEGRKCNVDSASFQVRQIHRDAAGAIRALWVTFQQRCGGANGLLAGEVRVSADTSVYIQTPAEHLRVVGQPVSFPVRGEDSRGHAVTLGAIDMPDGATFTNTDAQSGHLDYTAAGVAGEVRPFTFVAESDDGRTDTVTTILRTFPPDFLHISSAPGDPVGGGTFHDLTAVNGDFIARLRYGQLEILWNGYIGHWLVAVAAPFGRLPAVGTYANAVSTYNRGRPQPAITVNHFGQPAEGDHGGFQIRKLSVDSAGVVQSVWMTFEASANDNPGMQGEFSYRADTSYYVEGPADVFVDPDEVIRFELSARGSLAADVTWTLESGLDGTLEPAPDGTVAFQHPGDLEPGDYPVEIRASGASGEEHLTTWIHVAGPSFVSIEADPSYLFPAGFDQRFTDREGVLSIARNPGNSVSTRFHGDGHIFQFDLWRGGGLKVVPGDYEAPGPVSGSPNGITFMFDGSMASLTTGSFHVHEAVYGPEDVLLGLWATFETGMANAPGMIRGEVHVFPNLPTAVLVSIVDVTWDGSGVVVRGHSAGAMAATVRVERCTVARDWTSRGIAAVDGTGRLLFHDPEVVRGGRYGYRFVDPAAGSVSSEAWVDVPAPAALSVRRAGPNPGPGPLRFEISLPAAGPARLEVFDLTGRLVEQRSWDRLTEGGHLVALGTTAPIRPGLYFVRVLAAERSASRSFVVLE